MTWQNELGQILTYSIPRRRARQSIIEKMKVTFSGAVISSNDPNRSVSKSMTVVIISVE